MEQLSISLVIPLKFVGNLLRVSITQGKTLILIIAVVLLSPKMQMTAQETWNSQPITVENADQITLLHTINTRQADMPIAYRPLEPFMSSDGLRLIVPYYDSAMYDPVDSTFQVWNLETDTFIELSFIGERNPTFPYFSPAGHIFAVRTSNRLSVFDGETGSEIRYWEGVFGPEIWFNPSGQLLAFFDVTNFTERYLVIWDVENQQEINRIPTGSASVTDLSFSMDGAYLAFVTARDLYKCSISNTEIGECGVYFHSDDQYFFHMMITTNSQKILLESLDQVLVLDVVNAQQSETVEHTAPSTIMFFSQQVGDVLIVSNDDQPLLLNVLSGETVPIVDEFARFSPDFSMYVLGSGDDPYAVKQTTGLYSTESNALLAEFTLINSGGGGYIKFSPNGDYIVAQVPSGEIQIWGVPAN